jgi:hypothetical protein
MPPWFAVRDMERAHSRFVNAVSSDREDGSVPPGVLAQAKRDMQRFRDAVVFERIEGIEVVKADAINLFIHRVTGHPKAWILSWQLHSYAATLAGLSLDRPDAAASFRIHVEAALAAFADSFNREFKN